MKYESLLRDRLTVGLAPEHLELINESPNHGLPEAAEKHFRVVAVSAKFAGAARIERHRLVHSLVAVELRDHVHALSVQAFTPEEWAKRAGATHDSPECLHGGKREGVGDV